jgi:hypothetical protein
VCYLGSLNPSPSTPLKSFVTAISSPIYEKKQDKRRPKTCLKHYRSIQIRRYLHIMSNLVLNALGCSYFSYALTIPAQY